MARDEAYRNAEAKIEKTRRAGATELDLSCKYDAKDTEKLTELPESLGRDDYARSVHWQRGLVLEDTYGAGALVEHIGYDIRITVRSPYPERFLSALTYDVKWLVENFWSGLRCNVMVPCIEPCGKNLPGTGLFDVEKLIDSKRHNRPDYPCTVCNQWQNIGQLLHNAPAARPSPLEELLGEFVKVQREVKAIGSKLTAQHGAVIGRFDKLDANAKELMIKIEDAYTHLMRTFLDEVKEGPPAVQLRAG